MPKEAVGSVGPNTLSITYAVWYRRVSAVKSKNTFSLATSEGTGYDLEEIMCTHSVLSDISAADKVNSSTSKDPRLDTHGETRRVKR